MNLIDFEKGQGETVMLAEKAIEEGMKKYNLGRLATNVAEIVKDVWDDIGFKADSMDLTYYGSGPGSCQIAVKDSQLELLVDEDINDLIKAIPTYFDGTALKQWAAVDAWVSDKGITVEAKILHPITQARQFYKFWQDVTAKGTKEMGL